MPGPAQSDLRSRVTPPPAVALDAQPPIWPLLPAAQPDSPGAPEVLVPEAPSQAGRRSPSLSPSLLLALSFAVTSTSPAVCCSWLVAFWTAGLEAKARAA